MRRRAHPRTLNARLPQGLGEARALASDGPGVGATFLSRQGSPGPRFPPRGAPTPAPGSQGPRGMGPRSGAQHHAHSPGSGDRAMPWADGGGPQAGTQVAARGWGHSQRSGKAAEYCSSVSLGRYIPKYFILFVAMVNGIVSLISLFSHC